MNFKTDVIAYLQTQVAVQAPAIPCRVLNAYPKGLELLPCISVNHMAGSLERQFIGGGRLGVVQNAAGDWVDTESAYWRQSLEVSLWTTNPKTRDVLANACRMVLWRMVRYFSDTADVHEMRVTEQGDGQDLEQRAPADVFSAVFEVSALIPIDIEWPLEISEGFELTADLNDTVMTVSFEAPPPAGETTAPGDTPAV